MPFEVKIQFSAPSEEFRSKKSLSEIDNYSICSYATVPHNRGLPPNPKPHLFSTQKQQSVDMHAKQMPAI